MSKSQRTINTIGIALALLTLILYGMTKAVTIASIDGGELVAVQVHAGVSHPPGYPLFTILGYLWSLLPIGVPVASWLTWLSVIYGATAVYFFFRSFVLLAAGNKTPDRNSILAAGVATAMLVTGQVIWSASTIIEVYALQVLLMSLLLYAVIKVWAGQPGVARSWVMAGTALGMALSNHLTAVAFVPGLLFLIAGGQQSSRGRWRAFFFTSAVALLVMIGLYSYLPIRAAQDPPLNWGDIHNVQTFVDHIGARLYRGYAVPGIQTIRVNFSLLADSISSNVTWLGLLFAAWGVRIIYVRNREMAIFLLSSLIINLAMVLNYNIPDLSAFFLPAIVILITCLSVALRSIVEVISEKFGFGFAMVICLIPLFQVIVHYNSCDQSKNTAQRDFIVAAHDSADEGAVILATEFELDIAPSYYSQLVEGHRPDLAVCDMRSLVSQTWYLKQFENAYPSIVDLLHEEWDAHKESTILFRTDEDQYRLQTQESFARLVNALVWNGMQSSAIYITPGTYDSYLGPGANVPLSFDHWIVPQTYFYEVVPKREYVPFDARMGEIVIPQVENDRAIRENQQLGQFTKGSYQHPKFINGQLRMRCALMLDHRIQYEIRHEQWEMADGIASFLATEYPAYNLDSRIVNALRNRAQIQLID